jgi:hypothetical protein
MATSRVTATRFLLLPSTPEDHTSGWADSAFRLMCNRRRDETLLLRNVQLARRKKLRKAMLLTAMLAMALAAVAPAFAQDSIVNQEADQSGVVDDSVCSQVYNIAVQQYNAGDQNANANASAAAGATAGAFGSAAVLAIADADAANIANTVGIDIDTVNVCLNNFTTVAGQVQYKKTVTPTAKTVWPKKNGKAKANPTTRAAVLPETGGAPLFAVGAGMLLIGGGVLARRIVR